MFERQQPIALNSHEHVLEIALDGGDPGAALRTFQERLVKREIAPPQMLGWSNHGTGLLRVTGPREVVDALRDEFAANRPRELSSVTLTCAGGPSSATCAAVLQRLDQEKIRAIEMTIGHQSLTVFLDRPLRDKAVQILHDLIPAAT